MSISMEIAQNLEPPKGVEAARHHFEKFVYNPGLDDLAGLYGVPELPVGADARLATLRAIANQYWDYRRGFERQEVDWGALPTGHDSSMSQAILAATRKLGLVESGKPSNRRPDFLVILGSANLAPIDRLSYGLSSVENFNHLVYLGASRSVSQPEQTKVAAYAPNAVTEFDLGCGAFETVLGAKTIAEVNLLMENEPYRVRLYGFQHNGTQKYAWALNTPREVNYHRATTYDNYRFFAHWANLEKNSADSVVAVTNAYNAHCQGFPGIQELTLPFGTTVETIGYGPASEPSFVSIPQLLQETKAGIDAAARLRASLQFGC